MVVQIQLAIYLRNIKANGGKIAISVYDGQSLEGY